MLDRLSMLCSSGSRWRRPHNKRQQHRAVVALVRWTLNRCAFWVLRTLPQNAPLIGPLCRALRGGADFLMGRISVQL